MKSIVLYADWLQGYRMPAHVAWSRHSVAEIHAPLGEDWPIIKVWVVMESQSSLHFHSDCIPGNFSIYEIVPAKCILSQWRMEWGCQAPKVVTDASVSMKVCGSLEFKQDEGQIFTVGWEGAISDVWHPWSLPLNDHPESPLPHSFQNAPLRCVLAPLRTTAFTAPVASK